MDSAQEAHQTYRDAVRESLRSFYLKVRQGQVDAEHRARLQGLLRGGILLDAISSREARSMMEAAHFSVFNQTLEERLARKDRLQAALQDHQFDLLDEPTYKP